MYMIGQRSALLDDVALGCGLGAAFINAVLLSVLHNLTVTARFIYFFALSFASLLPFLVTIQHYLSLSSITFSLIIKLEANLRGVSALIIRMYLHFNFISIFSYTIIIAQSTIINSIILCSLLG